MIHLGIPVMDGHELTWQCLLSLAETVEHAEDLRVYVIDNGSETPYIYDEYELAQLPFAITIIRNDVNRGYYWPLLQVAAEATEADLVGLAHNDVIWYENGWDTRLVNQFVLHERLGMVGFCGSDEVDDRGGRGGGTMCNFLGEKGALTEHTGRAVHFLEPALILDSMVMIMRKAVVPLLRIDDSIPICHFIDKVWPLRLWESGWRVGVLGVKIDHMGGQTAVANGRFAEDCKRWLLDRGMDPGGDASLAVYLDSEKRFLDEFRPKGLIPSRLEGWKVVRTN